VAEFSRFFFIFSEKDRNFINNQFPLISGVFFLDFTTEKDMIAKDTKLKVTVDYNDQASEANVYIFQTAVLQYEFLVKNNLPCTYRLLK
jgi:hypothetical protein